jgi:uncharacterized protein YkwD
MVLGIGLALPTVASAMTWKQSLLSQINAYRVRNHRAPLHFNTNLGTAAQAHSNNMARYHLFSHASSNGVSWITRIRYYGYRGRYLGENLAVGQFTPSAVLRAWVNSPEHRANLLAYPYRSIGIGVTRGYYGGRWAYWITNDFGGYL